jgi:hypothetical protein
MAHPPSYYQAIVDNTPSLRDPSPWVPMDDPTDLKHLGKFGEELGECVASVCRSIIQGIDGEEPTTRKSNHEWLEDEVADVIGNAELVMEHFGLDNRRIRQRAEMKKIQLRKWHAMRSLCD